jgi:CHAD domain-containing protein/CYTH domain-containing protein
MDGSRSGKADVLLRVPFALPELLVDEGARRVALAYLDDATAARDRLTGAADPEALHDYRVALRRLRSCVRAYRKELRSSVNGRITRRLRRLAQATNQPRDLQVHLAWLDGQLSGAGDVERSGIRWLAERLSAEKGRCWTDMLALDAERFPWVHSRLTSRLTRFRTTLELDEISGRRSTAVVTARRVRSASRRLQRRLDRVQTYSDRDEIHRARIAAKRLRYLIEPFATFLPACEPVIARLKELQDGFGDVHDAHVFEGELWAALADARIAALAGLELLPGLEALLAALNARGQHAFEHTWSSWIGEAAAPFFQSVSALADELAELVHRDREIERKFLLRGLPPLNGAMPPVDIEQGYLPGERLIERLRRIRSGDGVELVRTIKAGTGLTRLELEEPVGPDLFERLWPLTEGRRLHKQRYRIPDGELTWEIDEFLDRELVLAEVELHGRPLDVGLPPWLEPLVDREVTEDESYSNYRLAVGRKSASDGHSV